MGRDRRGPRRDFEITVQGEVREDIDVESLLRLAKIVTRDRMMKAAGDEEGSPGEQPRVAAPPFASSQRQAAQALSERLLGRVGRRWMHVQAVAGRAERLSDAVRRDERDVLISAAWLHDIGYTDQLVVTGLHALDGAQHLRDRGWPDEIVSLVAHHTGAIEEAKQRGLADQLAAFAMPRPALLDALTAADMVTSPDGEWVRAEDRVAEILQRYAPEHPVHRAVTQSQSSLLFAVSRVERRSRFPVQPARRAT